jgi:hypothetical protein
MQKPNGYDEVRAAGEFIPVDLGGHYAVIKQVTEMQSSTSKPMIVVLFDFDRSDRQAEYHGEAFRNDTRADKKWPFNGTKYIMVNDYRDPSKTSKDFKAFCTCYERSNNTEIVWGGNDWGKQFRGKRIGVVYGEEENEYDGKTFMRRVPRWFCTWEGVKDARIPDPKLLKGHAAPANPAANNSAIEGLVSIPDGVDEEIPF